MSFVIEAQALPPEPCQPPVVFRAPSEFSLQSPVVVLLRSWSRDIGGVTSQHIGLERCRSV